MTTVPAMDVGVVEVIIDDFRFGPQVLEIDAGTTVVFTNREEYEHTATSRVHPRAFDSGTLNTDENYMTKFDTPGTYDYICLLHPMMTGTITVK